MNIELIDLTIRDLVAGYSDEGEDGVRGFGGKLNIRPPFQREFVYSGKQREEVIRTILRGFPLNVMYWSDNGNGEYEIIDGQQRTISIAQYYIGDFSVKSPDPRYFHSLTPEERDKVLDYKLTVYICTGSESDKLDWFRIVNIAGEKLTDQELRNSAYPGSWVTDAKRYFSRAGGPASDVGGDYLTGKAIRQEYLETVIKWISHADDAISIEEYMSKHQHDENAKPLWEYFQSVIDWVESTFIKKRKKFMKGVGWGYLYNEYKDEDLDTDHIESETLRLLHDDDVTNQKGIYEYILSGEEKHLNIRAFSDGMKQRVYEKQGGKCKKCGGEFYIEDMEADHITPWSEGGKTNDENCQMLCRPCNREKAAS